MKDWILTQTGHLVGVALAGLIHLLTAPRIVWTTKPPGRQARVYFANHTSNADTVLIWAALPPKLRRRTRPVAAADYWLKNGLRKFFGTKVFYTVLIQRQADQRGDEDPVGLMGTALDGGSSLIIFPEGRRNDTEDPLLPFKTGLFHLASARPDIDLVPVWIDNLNGVMPRGEVIPVPLICQIFFGAPIRLRNDEDKELFLARASNAMLALRPGDTA
ncbi:MAG: lysophospholipid acyltransferase family protein [Paracoccaceae bacterium]